MSIKIAHSKEFGKNLVYYYKKKGVSQKDLAEIAGVSTGTVCDWCKGRVFPRMDKIQKLAEYLGCEKSDLIEERTSDNTYYIKKESDALFNEIANNPKLKNLFKKMQKLSDHDIEMVDSLVSRMLKEDE